MGGKTDYISAGLMLLQAVIIPLTMFVWRLHMAKLKETQAFQKEIIDKETQIRKHERDAEIREINSRIAALEKDTDNRIAVMEKEAKHMVNSVIESQNRTADTLKRLFDRFDDMYKKMEEFSVFMRVHGKS